MAGPPILDAFFKMIEDRSRRQMLNQIHKDMPEDLMVALGKWLDAQNIKTINVLSLLAYFLAHTIYEESECEDDGCAGAQAYGDYIHSVVHRLFQEFPKEGLADVTPPRSKKH